MGFYTQSIGKDFPHGFAGSYAYQPDMIVKTRPVGGNANIIFGTPVKYEANTNGNVVPMGAGDTAAAFVGFASREIKSSINYLEQGVGQYAPGGDGGVFMRGAINVKVQKGTPAMGGKVYVRIAANEAYPTAVVGGIEAEPDTPESGSSNTVELPGCVFEGPADANGIACVRILTLQNA